MKKYCASILCLLVLAGAAFAKEDDSAAFFVQGGNVHLQTPSPSGNFFVNGINMDEMISNVDGLVEQVVVAVEENNVLKVGQCLI
jgi:hypothetical protein